VRVREAGGRSVLRMHRRSCRWNYPILGQPGKAIFLAAENFPSRRHAARRNQCVHAPFGPAETIKQRKADMGRSILLWLLGVPIPIIILIALLWH
jgi:hypothetical protein